MTARIFQVGVCTAIGLLGMMLPAQAAPLCISKYGMKPECVYFDAGLCQKRAEEMRGQCAVDPRNIRKIVGKMPYCNIDSSLYARCVYTERRGCLQEVRRSGGACIENRNNRLINDPALLEQILKE